PQVLLFEFEADELARDSLLELRSRLDESAGMVPVRFRFKTGNERMTYAPDGLRFDPAALELLKVECPWLNPVLTLDREQLLRDRRQNGWSPAAEPAAASVDVPF